ncbi:MAG: SDR family oxidoreductase [Candidatus Eremiobacteraeota bacterium]|nr:SDR family oxidoreductase [Candidatus Eremiobacteraeota bacterium]MCW5868856.1 SDR family oxidoreductase [Candidatus Eremiobacteraeota bacterium]
MRELAPESGAAGAPEDQVFSGRQADGAAEVLAALGRLGESEDVGQVIASLLSPKMGRVTGQILEASGGFRL